MTPPTHPTHSAPPPHPAPARRECGDHVVLPAERFYWAVVTTRALPGPRRLSSARFRDQCRHLAEPSLPCELERLQVAFAPLGDSTMLACALEHSVIASEAPPPRVIALTPDRVPEEVLGDVESDDRSDGQPITPRPQDLNLLFDRFEPPLVRDARRQTLLTAVVVAALALSVVPIGLERRVGALTTSSQSLKAEEDRLVASILPALPDDSLGAGQSPRVRLLAEWRRLEQTRGADPSDVVLDLDAAAPLAALLERWPSGAHATVQSLSATASSLVIRCEAPTDQAETIVGALLPWDDWRRLQPELTTRQGVATVTSRFTRGAAAPSFGVTDP